MLDRSRNASKDAQSCTRVPYQRRLPYPVPIVLRAIGGGRVVLRYLDRLVTRDTDEIKHVLRGLEARRFAPAQVKP